jgi:hypothetical protein
VPPAPTPPKTSILPPYTALAWLLRGVWSGATSFQGGGRMVLPSVGVRLVPTISTTWVFWWEEKKPPPLEV